MASGDPDRAGGTAPDAAARAPVDAEGRVRLAARDADDLAVLSALVQDAILPVKDMRFLREDGQFVAVVNRFRWEAPRETDEDGAPVYARTLAGLAIAGAEAVQSRGIDRADGGRLLNVLALEQAPVEGDRVAVTLRCAEGADVRVLASDLRVVLEDLGEDWPTRWRPEHPDAAPGAENGSGGR